MEGAPNSVDQRQIFADLMSVPGVVGVHSFRVWALKSETLASSVHLELTAKREEAMMGGDIQQIIDDASRCLTEKHRIHFVTIQASRYKLK